VHRRKGEIHLEIAGGTARSSRSEFIIYATFIDFFSNI
jgi:hypothetical protein